jgi:NitT/TauT family transport system permease protein
MFESFKIGGEVSTKTSLLISAAGFVILVGIWYVIAAYSGVSISILPSPFKVLTSFQDLFTQYHLMANTWFSVKLNLMGYLEAILISIPLGFLMGLIPFFRSLISKYFDALRFLPLPAVTGIFIAWFGIELTMKVHFLAFGIMLYLIPVIVQRIDEIEKTHIQTMTTLGANAWNKLRHLYFPYVISKISDDVRVLVAISWTYIIIAELINKEGGVGAMIFTATKQSRTDMVFALLIVIVIVGYLQDILFKKLDKWLFPFKHDGAQVKTSTFALSMIFKPKK